MHEGLDYYRDFGRLAYVALIKVRLYMCVHICIYIYIWTRKTMKKGGECTSAMPCRDKNGWGRREGSG